MANQVPVKDPTSQSNYTKIKTKHLSLDWTIDFEKRYVYGSATHQLLAIEDVDEVTFDTYALDIQSVEVNENIVETRLYAEHPVMGSALNVSLPLTNARDTVTVKITYKTTEKCSALMWLEKELTEGKKFPYLFSQCQPIHARSLVPIQDTPSVKLTYDAKVTSVLPVLLSAQRVSPPSDGPPHGGSAIGKDAITYEYRQMEPIPSYLLAIAAGNLHYRPFVVPTERMWRSGIWTEPELLEAAYNEFCDDAPRYLAAAEDIIGPYRFRVYDLLVLPNAFPYGGMENPCITFVTPTLITGDRSLTGTIIHELSHSWFGNGVTHAHASHFWLNEGWTTYIERLLLQLVRSPGDRGLSYATGYKELVDALELYQTTPKYQRLVIGFDIGEDPDMAYSRVPYDKGAHLLLFLEQTLGGVDAFLPYIKSYVQLYMGRSITTKKWMDHLYQFFSHKEQILDQIDWNAWLYGEGVTLPNKPVYDMTLVTAANDLADRWNASRHVNDPSELNFKPSDLDALNSGQQAVFLKHLETYPALPSDHLVRLDALYKFSQSTNTEIRVPFYLVMLKDGTSWAAKHFVRSVLDWVTGKSTGTVQGRMKFCRPLLRAANKVDRELTVGAFVCARCLFHPIARKLVEQDLGLNA